MKKFLHELILVIFAFAFKAVEDLLTNLRKNGRVTKLRDHLPDYDLVCVYEIETPDGALGNVLSRAGVPDHMIGIQLVNHGDSSEKMNNPHYVVSATQLNDEAVALCRDNTDTLLFGTKVMLYRDIEEQKAKLAQLESKPSPVVESKEEAPPTAMASPSPDGPPAIAEGAEIRPTPPEQVQSEQRDGMHVVKY